MKSPHSDMLSDEGAIIEVAEDGDIAVERLQNAAEVKYIGRNYLTEEPGYVSRGYCQGIILRLSCARPAGGLRVAKPTES